MSQVVQQLQMLAASKGAGGSPVKQNIMKNTAIGKLFPDFDVLESMTGLKVSQGIMSLFAHVNPGQHLAPKATPFQKFDFDQLGQHHANEGHGHSMGHAASAA